MASKAGLKPPMKDKAQHNQWIVDTFINRTADSKQTISTLRNLPEIWRKGGDLVPKEIIRRINMDYDFKRRPVNPATRPINGTDHLCFDTVRWRSVDEFVACREQWEQFHASSGVVLKTPDDLAQFEEYRAVDGSKAGLKRSKKDTANRAGSLIFFSVCGLRFRCPSSASTLPCSPFTKPLRCRPSRTGNDEQ